MTRAEPAPTQPAPTQPAPGALLGSGDEADVFVRDELTPGGPVVIDWRNGADGPAALDLARSAVIMAHVAVTPGTELAGVAHALLTAFLARVGPVPADALDAAIAHRARDSTVSAEARDRLPAVAALIRVTC